MSRGVTGPVVAVVAVGPNDVAAVAGGAPATAPVRKVAPGMAAMEAAVDTVGAEVAPNGAAARAQASRVEGVPPVVRVDRDELTERIGNQTVPGRVPVTEGDVDAGSRRLRSLTGREGVRSSHRVPAMIAGVIDMSPVSEGDPICSAS